MAAALAAGVLLISACAQDPAEMAKKKSAAPAFSTTTSTGKTVTLKDLTKKGPVFLYFVKEHCGANPDAMPLFNAIARAHPKANLYMVIDTDQASFQRFSRTFRSTTPALLDPSKKIIKSYGMRSSQTAVMVDRAGKITQFYPGFGQDSLKSLNASLAGVAKRPVPNVDLSGAPQGTRFG